MTLKSCAKFEEKLTLGYKNYMRNLVNFNESIGKSKILHFNVLPFSKLYYIDPKKVHRSSVITLENDAKFEQELTCALKHDVRNLANFDTTRKICTLMGFFWPKYIMFDLKKYRGVMRHYTKDWYKLCRKNDMWFHKWHEKFGEFLRSTQKT